MKVKPQAMLSALQSGRGKFRVYYFCGPDEAGAEAAAERIATLIAPESEKVELAGADLRRDPPLLTDEARSTSLFGGSRHIVVRASGDDAHDAVANFIEDGADACPVLIVATSATDRSRIAKLLAPRDDAMVVTFYAPDLRTVTSDVRAMAAAAGVTLAGPMAERIARASLLDLRLARSEVTKIALFLDATPQQPKQADPEAVEAILTRSEEDSFGPLVATVLSGRHRQLPAELARLRELGINPVGLVLALQRRASQLAGLAGQMGDKGDVASFIEKEKQAGRVFFRDQAELSDQLRRWRGQRLDRLLQRLVALHRRLLATSQSAELFLAQELTEITRRAAAQAQR